MQTTIRKRFFFLLATAFVVLGFSVPVLFAQNQIPIDFGQTVPGTIDVNDPTLPDGRHVDIYVFNITQPNQPYVITVHAPSFAVHSVLLGLDAQQQIFPIQGAYVGMPDGQVQYSGTLVQPGQYAIEVLPGGDPATTGPYTLTLSEHAGLDGQCVGGTRESPVMIATGQTLTCTLTDQDEQFSDEQGNVYFGKYFSYQSDGQPFTITAQSKEFQPFLQVYNPATEELVVTGEDTVTVNQLPPGPVRFALLANQPNTVGSFTISLTQGGMAGGDSHLAGTALFGLGTYAFGSTWLQSNFDQLAVVACEPDWDIPGQTLGGCLSQISTRLHSLHEEPGGYVASWRIDGLKAGQEYVVHLYCDVNGDGQWDGITNPLEGPRLWPPPGSPADFAYFPPRDDILLPYTLDVPPPPCGVSPF